MAPTKNGSRVPTRELFFATYQAALDAVVVFPDLARTLIEVRGSRAVQVLNGLVTNAVEPVTGGQGCYTFMLGPKGRTIAEFRVLPAPGFETGVSDDEVLWMDAPSSNLDAILAHFQKYVPPIFAVYESVDVGRLSLVGPRAEECLDAVLDEAVLEVARAPQALCPLEAASVVGSDGLLVRREPVEGTGFDLYASAERLTGLTTALEAAAASLGGVVGHRSVWELLRIERGIPAYASELSPERLAQEAGQDERAISFEKGCYTGQEVVARIHYRGHVNRLLRGLRIAEGEAAALSPGRDLVREGRKVGVVCSVAESPRFGTIALAYVRREIDPGERVEVGDGAIAQVEVAGLPFT